jgi:chaperone required for assembly of F1-ATPase
MIDGRTASSNSSKVVVILAIFPSLRLLWLERDVMQQSINRPALPLLMRVAKDICIDKLTRVVATEERIVYA